MTPYEYLEKQMENEHLSVVSEGHCKEYYEGFSRGMTRMLEILAVTAKFDRTQRSAELAEKLKSSDLRVINGGGTE